jgi:fluoroacetyl-CoA thioesterase
MAGVLLSARSTRVQNGRMQPGDHASLELTVTEADTAAALGSGDLPVLGTPRLLAWAEAATCAVVAEGLADGQTSVGTRVRIEHVAASPVGAGVRVTATLTHADPPTGPLRDASPFGSSGQARRGGRLLRFDVVAMHRHDEKVVGHGEVTRVVVDRDRFLSRL